MRGLTKAAAALLSCTPIHALVLPLEPLPDILTASLGEGVHGDQAGHAEPASRLTFEGAKLYSSTKRAELTRT